MLDEIECDLLDEDMFNEASSAEGAGGTARNIHSSSFVNKLKDFSSFNPSGNKGKEKILLQPPIILASKRDSIFGQNS